MSQYLHKDKYSKQSEKSEGDYEFLTYKEAQIKNEELLENFEPQSILWPFTKAKYFIFGPVFCSGWYTIELVRKFAKVKGVIGFGLGIGAAAFMPATTAFGFNIHYVQNDVMLHRTKCSVCLTVKTQLMQVAMGVILPVLAAPLTIYPLAIRDCTMHIPHVFSKDFLLMLKKMYGKHQMIYLAFAMLHLLIPGVLTYYQYSAIENVHAIINEREKIFLEQKQRLKNES